MIDTLLEARRLADFCREQARSHNEMRSIVGASLLAMSDNAVLF